MLKQFHPRYGRATLAGRTLGDISHPLLVWLVGFKFPLQDVWRNPTELTSIGAVLLGTNEALQLQLPHQSLDRLVIDLLPHIAKRAGNATIAIPPLVLIEDSANLCLHTGVLVL